MRDGLLVVNKPQGMTSHDVVQVVRRRVGLQRVGHTGTLDPIAEGVLVILVGAATKYQQILQTQRKVYEAVIQLGTQTDTGDAWGKALRTAPVPALEQRQVEETLRSFVGRLTQTPPAFSAVKVQGKPLYWWTRRGVPKVAQPRTVEILALDLLGWDGSALACRIVCSSGTYIRTLAEAVAARLGTVGHVKALTRCAVGPWELARAVTVPWIQAASEADVRAALRPVITADAWAARA